MRLLNIAQLAQLSIVCYESIGQSDLGALVSYFGIINRRVIRRMVGDAELMVTTPS